MKKLILFASIMLAIFAKAQASMRVEARDVNTLEKSDLKWIVIDEDKFENRTFIKFKNAFYNRPYISLKDGIMNLRFVWRYEGKDWLFFDKIILLNNGQKFEIENLEPDTNVALGSVSERVDISASGELYDFLRNALDCGSEISIRFQGKGVYDSKFKKSDITIFNSIFNIYEKLKK